MRSIGTSSTNVRTIPLYGKYGAGKTALVDDSDYEAVVMFRWIQNRDGYVTSGSGTHRKVLHRHLMSPGSDHVVDHRNGNKLDNRRLNLRVCKQRDNSHNRVKQKNNTSGYKGVYSKGKRWQAAICYNRKLMHLGTYDSPEVAAKAYDIAAGSLYGQYARLNEVA